MTSYYAWLHIWADFVLLHNICNTITGWIIALISFNNEQRNIAKYKPHNYVCGCSLPRRLTASAGGLASLLVRRPCCGLFSLSISTSNKSVYLFLMMVSNSTNFDLVSDLSGVENNDDFTGQQRVSGRFTNSLVVKCKRRPVCKVMYVKMSASNEWRCDILTPRLILSHCIKYHCRRGRIGLMSSYRLL